MGAAELQASSGASHVDRPMMPPVGETAIMIDSSCTKRGVDGLESDCTDDYDSDDYTSGEVTHTDRKATAAKQHTTAPSNKNEEKIDENSGLFHHLRKIEGSNKRGMRGWSVKIERRFFRKGNTIFTFLQHLFGLLLVICVEVPKVGDVGTTVIYGIGVVIQVSALIFGIFAMWSDMRSSNHAWEMFPDTSTLLPPKEARQLRSGHKWRQFWRPCAVFIEVFVITTLIWANQVIGIGLNSIVLTSVFSKVVITIYLAAFKPYWDLLDKNSSG